MLVVQIRRKKPTTPIGITISKVKEQVVITNIDPNTPASIAGLKVFFLGEWGGTYSMFRSEPFWRKVAARFCGARNAPNTRTPSH